MSLPYPPDLPLLSKPTLFECFVVVWLAVHLVGFCMPRQWFRVLFEMLYPWMPHALSDWDR